MAWAAESHFLGIVGHLVFKLQSSYSFAHLKRQLPLWVTTTLCEYRVAYSRKIAQGVENGLEIWTCSMLLMQ